MSQSPPILGQLRCPENSDDGHGAPEGSELARMMARKPRMLVAVALANRMVRIAWALMRNEEVYRDPAAAAATA